MISIRKQIDEAEALHGGFRAMRKAYLDLTKALPKAALPANPALSGQCQGELEKLAALLGETPALPAIGEAGKLALDQLEAIYHSNRTAVEERDNALKDVVASVADAISSFKGHGERNENNLGRLADEFDSLSRVDSVTELRRRLRDQVGKLRHAAHEMRQENINAAQQFASQISSYQQRLEAARKDSGVDRLTGLGSRREAEQHLRGLPARPGPVTLLLLDIKGFRHINDQYGALFGDKLLRALAGGLQSRFPREGSVFRWGADQFLVIAEGSLASCTEECRDFCHRFAVGGRSQTTLADGSKIMLAAAVAFGATQYGTGDSVEELIRRVHASLDQNRNRPNR
jgi:diguanylate cyclase (GGDEF)-like protein